MRKLLAAFTINSLQSAVTLHDWLEQNGRDIEDVRSHIRKYAREGRVVKEIRRKAQKHCTCGGAMIGYRVNVSKCTDVGGNYTMQFNCSTCGKEEYT